MPWNTISATDVLVEFTPDEKAALERIQDSSTRLATVLSTTVGVIRGNITAGNYGLGLPNTIPDQLRQCAIDVARWRWLVSFPQLKALQTEERKAANDAAMELLNRITTRSVNVEPPASQAVNVAIWNSDHKLISRTQNVPAPGLQFPSTYANPDGPKDSSL